MTFHRQDRDMYLHTILNYEDAKTLYEKLKPIRGQSKDEVGVPLQPDRKNWGQRSLRKWNTEPPAYSARLYDTNCVTWYEGGAIVVDCSYVSSLTGTFISQFFRRAQDHEAYQKDTLVNLYASFTHGGFMVLDIFKASLAQWVYEANGEPIRFNAERDTVCSFKLCTNGQVTFIPRKKTPLGKSLTIDMDEVLRPYKLKLDKGKAHKIRGEYAPFFEYFKFFDAYPDCPISVKTCESILKNVGVNRPEWTIGNLSCPAHVWIKSMDEAGVLSDFITDPSDQKRWPAIAAYIIVLDEVVNVGGHGDFTLCKAFKKRLYAEAYKQHHDRAENIYSTVYLDNGEDPSDGGVRISTLTYGGDGAIDI